MKIAITGHTAGIGKALAQAYHKHEIIGLSKRDGNNIRNIPKIADLIEPADVFINNAQAGYAQTELLFEMCKRWSGSVDKHIVVISTMMTQWPVSTIPELAEYRIQKISLEQAVQQLRYIHWNPRITIVRPGDIATSPEKTMPPSADVDVWARSLVQILELADANGLDIPEISLGAARI